MCVAIPVNASNTANIVMQITKDCIKSFILVLYLTVTVGQRQFLCDFGATVQDKENMTAKYYYKQNSLFS
jgi:hypothetical protein